MEENEALYKLLRGYGYELVFREVLRTRDGKIKGNVDAELVLHAMIEVKDGNCDRVVTVANDGDYSSLAAYLKREGKLEAVLAPNQKYCSRLLKKALGNRIVFMDGLKEKLVKIREDVSRDQPL